jgi:hypothetical protein
LRWGTELLFDNRGVPAGEDLINSREGEREQHLDAQVDKAEQGDADRPTPMEMDGRGAGADSGAADVHISDAPSGNRQEAERQTEDPPNEAAAYSDDALDALVQWGTGGASHAGPCERPADL